MQIKNLEAISFNRIPNPNNTIFTSIRKHKFVTSPSRVRSRAQGLSIRCGVKFRPCIDIHKGKVKQIVSSTLSDIKESGSSLVTNFESDKSAAEYATMYKEDGLVGGHVIMLGADPLSHESAISALHAYPGGLQVGGGNVVLI